MESNSRCCSNPVSEALHVKNIEMVAHTNREDHLKLGELLQTAEDDVNSKEEHIQLAVPNVAHTGCMEHGSYRVSSQLMWRTLNLRPPHIFSRRSSSPSRRQCPTTRPTSWSSCAPKTKFSVALFFFTWKNVQMRWTWDRQHERLTALPLEGACLLDNSPPRTTVPQRTETAACERGRRGPETSPLVTKQSVHMFITRVSPVSRPNKKVSSCVTFRRTISLSVQCCHPVMSQQVMSPSCLPWRLKQPEDFWS